MSVKQLTIPREAIFILHRLQSAGFEAFLVGGAVRDLLRAAWQQHQNVSPYNFDYDFATNALPEQILQLFPESFYENEFGTVSLTLEHLWEIMEPSAVYKGSFRTLIESHQAAGSAKIIDLAKAKKVHYSLQNSLQNSAHAVDQSVDLPKANSMMANFEITTYRTDEVYQNGPRKPSQLQWGKTIVEDLQRRDFTINALAIAVDPKAVAQFIDQNQPKSSLAFTLSSSQFQLIDQHQSVTDLINNRVRTVGEPILRFKEDGLRMLRAIRFAVQLDMQIDANTLQAIGQSSDLLNQISFERIRDEFFKMLTSPSPKKAIELLDETNLLQYVLPELLITKGVEQGGHHNTDVWTHSLDAVQNCPSADPVVKLATLLHDISKPTTYKEINGQITAYNHEVIGARVAKQVAQRLRLSNRDQQRVFILVRYHMFHYQPENSDASIRRFMRKVGLENIDDILDLREADRLGSGAKKTSWRLEEMKKRMIEQLNQPLDVTDLAINGHDLIDQLGMRPGPQIGEVLNRLFEHVLENPEDNNRTDLLRLAAD